MDRYRSARYAFAVAGVVLCAGRGKLLSQTEKPLTFEVASLKQHALPNNGAVQTVSRGNTPALPGTPTRRFSFHLATFKILIALAYDLKPYQLIGLPDWAGKDGPISDEYYDVDAVAPIDNPTVGQLRQMLQVLLAERCSLRAHPETREIPVYVLTISKNGVKFQAPPGEPTRSSATWYTLLQDLSPNVEYPIIDRTGLSGYFDFPGLHQIVVEQRNSSASFAELFSERYGLDLKLKKESADVLVIDHIQRPSANP